MDNITLITLIIWTLVITFWAVAAFKQIRKTLRLAAALKRVRADMACIDEFCSKPENLFPGK